MPFPSPIPEPISTAESQALARYVHDVEGRMKQLYDLLQTRGASGAAGLACAIMRDLRALESELNASECPDTYVTPISIAAARVR